NCTNCALIHRLISSEREFSTNFQATMSVRSTLPMIRLPRSTSSPKRLNVDFVNERPRGSLDACATSGRMEVIGSVSMALDFKQNERQLKLGKVLNQRKKAMYKQLIPAD